MAQNVVGIQERVGGWDGSWPGSAALHQEQREHRIQECSQNIGTSFGECTPWERQGFRNVCG